MLLWLYSRGTKIFGDIIVPPEQIFPERNSGDKSHTCVKFTRVETSRVSVTSTGPDPFRERL